MRERRTVVGIGRPASGIVRSAVGAGRWADGTVLVGGAVTLLLALAGCTTAEGRAGTASASDAAAGATSLATVSPDVVPEKFAPPEPVAESTPPEPTEPDSTVTAVPPEPEFSSSISEITPEVAARMAGSWRPGCPVPLEQLRYVTVSHVDFDGAVQTGELVVHADVAESVVGVFATLFEARYPIRLMRLVDDFGADDTTSMEADNTSAFNCRAITGGSAWSEHAYGRALDLNPVENPYVVGRHVAPEAGRAFADRPDLPGVVHADDLVVQAFAAAGWHWGGYWSSPVDYQHFSVTGR